MAKGVIDADGILNRARPWVHQQAHEIQPFGHLVKLPIRSSSLHNARSEVIDTMHRAAAELKASGAEDVALTVGDRAPAFTLMNQDVVHVALDDLLRAGPLVVYESFGNALHRARREHFVKTGPDLSREELDPAGRSLARSPCLLETSRPGVFAVGDARSKESRR